MVVAVRLVNNTLGNRYGSDISQPSGLVNALLKAIFSSERLFIPTISFPFGVSILLVAKQVRCDPE